MKGVLMYRWFVALAILVVTIVACSNSGDSDQTNNDNDEFRLPEQYCTEVTLSQGDILNIPQGASLSVPNALDEIQVGGLFIWRENSFQQTENFFIPLTANEFTGQASIQVVQNDVIIPLVFDIPLVSNGCDLEPPRKPSNLDFGDYVNFESGQVRPLAITPAGDRLLAVNTPDAKLEIFAIDGVQLQLTASVAVGLDPVAVAVRNDSEAWVVNHISDSISIVDLTGEPRVLRTLQVGDEPRDIVFAGDNNSRAFISTARRGQNNSEFDESELTTPGLGRADIWVFDAETVTDEPLNILTLFADTPRALAVSADQKTVYAAPFMSGNQTTVIDQLIVDNDKPAPLTSLDGTEQPDTGLIVKYNGSRWIDEEGTDWSSAVNFNLPDYDVFSIDANTATQSSSVPLTGVGTTLFNMTVNPVSGVLYVSNTEARNQVRFEGMLTDFSSVRGHIAENRITVIKNDQVMPIHLNKHLLFSQTGTTEAAEKAKTLSQPMEMLVTPDGSRLYVVAFGSNKIAWFDTKALEGNSFQPDVNNQLVLPGGGPSGLVSNDDASLLYVMTRFNNGITIVRTSDHTIVGEVTLFNPEPQSVVDGRPFLYDASITSDNGANSCGSCHVFGDMDSLAWDLGDPGGEVIPDTNPFIPGTKSIPGGPLEFHPLKGPMTTQTLRGLDGHGSQHWRGDRTGQNRAMVNGELESVAAAAFKEFNPAFVGLIGRSEQLSDSDMQLFTDFSMTIVQPPNPIRALDNSLTQSQQNGRTNYFDSELDSGIFTCHDCHVLIPEKGFFGTDGRSSKEGGRVSQNFKVPHERNLYQKVGMFNGTVEGDGDGNGGAKPDQMRGFGFLHDGSVDTLDSFFHSSVFSFDSQSLIDDMVSFMFAFDNNIAPIVGQQVTVNGANKAAKSVRLTLLMERASVTGVLEECDLIARGIVNGERRGYLLVPPSTFVPDKKSESALSYSDLLSALDTTGEALTFTCVPPGSGNRMALDRDRNSIYNRDEN